MNGTGRHAPEASGRPPTAQRAPRRLPPGRRRSLLGSIAGVGNPARRLSLTALAAAAVAVTAIAAAVAASGSGGSATAGARLTGEVGPEAGASSPATAWAYAAPAVIGAGHAVVAQLPAQDTPLVLTAEDHKDCPAGAVACVDLARHLTWLQSDGKVSFGPVRMEPGKPGSGPHATPAGSFQVQWKAGPGFVSDIYNEPMPWATFFAPGGVAFHGGSLTSWSHGCVHLTVSNAHYYNEHLPIGAEVVVF
ncbi:MAG TPA: L,D-transpeptidase [Streptosporangiaceae bacterium]|jgi:L,D-transpeptidase catalytic domain